MEPQFKAAFRKGAEQRGHGVRRMITTYAVSKALIVISTKKLSMALRLAQIAITNEIKTIGQIRL
ncbi:MAG: hypothetical protein WBF89_12550 [Steroidobacteraceae bacterium]